MKLSLETSHKFNVDDVKIKISCEGVLAVVATVVGDSGCWR